MTNCHPYSYAGNAHCQMVVLTLICGKGDDDAKPTKVNTHWNDGLK